MSDGPINEGGVKRCRECKYHTVNWNWDGDSFCGHGDALVPDDGGRLHLRRIGINDRTPAWCPLDAKEKTT